MSGFLLFIVFLFFSPRSLPLDVCLYAFGSRTGILHSSAIAAGTRWRGWGMGTKTRLPPFPLRLGNGGVRFFGRKKFFQKVLTKRPSLCYNNQARKAYAAIAQSAERILGKDEVISSNLISSSKQPRDSIEFRGFGFNYGLL